MAEFQDPKISVIIPIYNSEKYLYRCVSSVINQSLHSLEIILVDDGSTDSSPQICDQFAIEDNRVFVIHKENEGASIARNKGVEVAKGEYVVFVDADDILMPTFFLEAYAFAKREKADFVVGEVIHTNSRKTPIIDESDESVQKYEIWDSKKFKNILATNIYKIENGGYIGRGPWARLIKRELLNDVRFLNNVKVGEDLLWNIAVADKSGLVYIIHKVWYIYWKNPESILNKYDPQIFLSCETGLKMLAKEFDFSNDDDLRAYCSWVFWLLYKCVYDDYLGNELCQMSFYKRWKNFCDINGGNPWVITQSKQFFKVAKLKEKLKILLSKTRLLFVYYTLKGKTSKLIHKIRI